MSQETAIVIFKEKNIRRVWNNDQWYFSVVDICAALTDSPDAGAYWRKLKQRLNEESKRTREIYKQKGYSDEWIEKRVRGIAVRDELTDEWKKRGVKEQTEYAILTAEISKATFGMMPTEYKTFKTLENPKDNLRDHMTDLE